MVSLQPNAQHKTADASGVKAQKSQFQPQEKLLNKYAKKVKFGESCRKDKRTCGQKDSRVA